MLFATPDLTDEEELVLDAIRKQWKRLRYQLQDRPARWTGLLRRSAAARGIRASNSIEGLEVSADDAVAAVDGDDPFDVDHSDRSWRAVLGYQRAMTFAIQHGSDPDAAVDATLLRSLHFMIVESDPLKNPGSWRPGPIYVHNEDGDRVYEGPQRELIPGLIDELVTWLQLEESSSLIVAAMAHLNLVMIHPFSDGNGRMARCLQTLVLARAGVLDPVFCSVEEWLGNRRNTVEYYDVLNQVGGGGWQPERDARPWVRFMLRAHHQQAAISEIRLAEIGMLWEDVECELERKGIDDRAAAPLVESALGRSMRNSRYRHLAAVNRATAGRDLKGLVEAGLLTAMGERRGRVYRASPVLQEIRNRNRLPRDLPDPYVALI